jgi:DNA polymerase III subunit gamma/tau
LNAYERKSLVFLKKILSHRMENFIVSARKYRPATFDTVVGQTSITSTLKNAIKRNHLAQAFLFTGPRGVGKTTCARILAKTINCENLSENIEACDKCESCVSFNNSASFNIHELDAASNNSVDDIRNLVDQVRIPPQVGKYKVYIIDEVHMLSQAAFNAFLKTLEEPPAYAKFILATTEKHKIIPTILSRCQIYDFKRITVEDIAKHIQFVAKEEFVEIEEEGVHIIAQKADGALRDALSIFDQIVSFSGNKVLYENVIQNLNVLDYDYYFKITDSIFNGDISKTLLIINEIIDNGFDGQYFIIGLGEHLRNLLVCKDPVTIKLLEAGAAIKAKYQEQSSNCQADLLIKALEINNDCDIYYKTSNNKQLHLEISLMKMCSLNQSKSKSTFEEKKVEISASQKPAPQIKPEYKTPQIQKTEVVQPTTQVTQTPQKPQTYSTQKKVIPGTISIKTQSIEKKVEETKENYSTNLQQPVREEKFTQEQLEFAWKSYAKTIENKNKDFYSTLINRNPEIKDDNIIEISIVNKLQENEFKDNRQDLLTHLRSELKNAKIQFRSKIIENVKEEKLYFPDQILKKMAEKNPNINKLKNQLNLEIEF